MRVSLILVACVLASCAPQTQYIRADGRYASQQSVEAALAECSSESKDSLCMVEKGYFSVSAEQAESKRAELAAIAQANEQAKVAKAKEKQRQERLAAEAAQAARKQALDEKKQKRRTVTNSTSGRSIWSNPPTFSSVAPVRQ
jgi:uncharacterized protein YdaU (DUF1376 family)